MRSVRVEGEETGTVIDHETTTSTDEQVVTANGLQMAHDFLEAYYKRHPASIKDIISSQWTRGVVSGRTEALNILKDAAERIRKEQ